MSKLNLGDFLKKTGTQYSAYLEAENTNFREEQKKIRYYNACNIAVSYYGNYAEILMEAINITQKATPIYAVNKAGDIYTDPCVCDVNGAICLRFKGYYNKNMGMPAQDVYQTLQDKLNDLTAFYQMTQLILLVQMGRNSRIEFYLSPKGGF